MSDAVSKRLIILIQAARLPQKINVNAAVVSLLFQLDRFNPAIFKHKRDLAML